MKHTKQTPERQATPLTPALRQWWRELASGQRTTATHDLLWRCACWEARGDYAARRIALELLWKAA